MIWWFLLAVNLLAFGLYGWDKLAASRAWRRVPEFRLLVVSAPLAALGAWAAVLCFRHKSSKPSYLVKLSLLTAAEALVVGWALGKGYFA
ncbi:MAG: DUF1294 domain-containing protein [Planctomycetota bacterium]